MPAMEETATAGAEGAAEEGRALSGTGTPADASRWRSTVLLPETGSPRERRIACRSFIVTIGPRFHVSPKILIADESFHLKKVRLAHHDV
jgi:hypothetical protein